MIEKFLASPQDALLGFFIVVFCFKELLELWKYFKGRGKEMYDKDAEHGEMKAEINSMKQKQAEQAAATEAMQTTLVNINKSLDKLNADRKADMVAQGRAMLYDLYTQLKDKPELTLGEHEVVSDVFKRYEEAGGNGTFKKISKVLLSKPLADE